MFFIKRVLSIYLIVVTPEGLDAVLNFDDENYFGYEADIFDWTKHPCRRTCRENQALKRCSYVFVVENFSSMSKACYNCPYNLTDCSRPHCIPADGKQKPIYTVNRQLPGPLVEVCENDIIEIEVRNRMLSESTTIHWHGFKQHGTPYMDGVPYVTQCPILPGDNFRYIFNATTFGTFFWHSHIGNQKSDGLFGALIVNRYNTKRFFFNQCDYDIHRMVITEWGPKTGDANFIEEYHYRDNVIPTTLLINGLGPSQVFNTSNGKIIQTPKAVFEVEKKNKYRMRLIDAGSADCPIEVSIDSHVLRVISLDSNDVRPVEVDAITIWPGERVDFIIETNQKVDNYWIRFRGYGLCQTNGTKNGIYQVAILRYRGAKIQDPTSPIGYEYPKMHNKMRILNPYNAGTESLSRVNVSIPDLYAIDSNDVSLREEVDQQVFIEFDFYRLDNYDFHRKDKYGYNQVASDFQIGTLQLNHISLKLPRFPLLSQWEMLKPNSLCNSSTISKTCLTEQCACSHVIQLKLNSVVELVFVDQGQFGVINHPLHLHGHFFRVVATEKLNGTVTIDRIKQLDREGKIKRRLDHPPLKDTMKAPGGGYTIVRLHANNPGYWFFHCHFEEHNNIGMALIFKVGEHEDFPEKPDNFPRCGNYLSNIM